MPKINETDNYGEILIYNSEDGIAKINVNLKDETVWLSLDQMAQLFQRDKSTISRHIKNVFAEGELSIEATVAHFATVQNEGGRLVERTIEYYNLDVIISVGYRVKSIRGTQFRIWANSVLKEYIKKGFALDDERLKGNGGGSYWKELLDRIRDIRSSEKMLYRQVLDLYATSVDYDPKSEESLAFFKIVQNKLHYAAHGNTAAEVIFKRADAQKPTGWQTKYMKTRWGTCNTVTKKIWLNVQLAKKTPEDIPKVTNFWDISVLLHRTTAHPRSEMYVLVHS